MPSVLSISSSTKRRKKSPTESTAAWRFASTTKKGNASTKKRCAPCSIISFHARLAKLPRLHSAAQDGNHIDIKLPKTNLKTKLTILKSENDLERDIAPDSKAYKTGL